MLVLQGTRGEMLELLKANADESAIFLKCKPSAALLAAVLNETKAKKIICTEGIRKTFTKKMLGALSEIGVELEISQLKQGRPFAVGEEKLERAKELLKAGKFMKEAASEAGISERTLYYRLAREKKRNV